MQHSGTVGGHESSLRSRSGTSAPGFCSQHRSKAAFADYCHLAQQLDCPQPPQQPPQLGGQAPLAPQQPPSWKRQPPPVALAAEEGWRHVGQQSFSSSACEPVASGLACAKPPLARARRPWMSLRHAQHLPPSNARPAIGGRGHPPCWPACKGVSVAIAKSHPALHRCSVCVLDPGGTEVSQATCCTQQVTHSDRAEPMGLDDVGVVLPGIQAEASQSILW